MDSKALQWHMNISILSSFIVTICQCTAFARTSFSDGTAVEILQLINRSTYYAKISLAYLGGGPPPHERIIFSTLWNFSENFTLSMAVAPLQKMLHPSQCMYLPCFLCSTNPLRPRHRWVCRWMWHLCAREPSRHSTWSWTLVQELEVEKNTIIVNYFHLILTFSVMNISWKLRKTIGQRRSIQLFHFTYSLFISSSQNCTILSVFDCEK